MSKALTNLSFQFITKSESVLGIAASYYFVPSKQKHNEVFDNSILILVYKIIVPNVKLI